MEAIIIITECKNPYGKYWEFKDKRSGQVLAEVDKKKEREFGTGPLYFVYTVRGGFLYETARHSKKDVAIEFAKRSILDQFDGVDVKFKMNVTKRIIKWS